MPVLDWIGKKAVVNHHHEVPYRLIHCDSELSAGDPDAGNLLVQGDNLEALKALPWREIYLSDLTRETRLGRDIWKRETFEYCTRNGDI